LFTKVRNYIENERSYSILDVSASSLNDLQTSTSQITPEETNEAAAAVPTKSDGTADMRFTASKEAVASGAVEVGEQLADNGGVMAAGDSLGCSGSLLCRSLHLSMVSSFCRGIDAF
jgi:hypothetical protein